MAVNSVNSDNYSFQIIRSTTNQKRVEEQSAKNDYDKNDAKNIAKESPKSFVGVNTTKANETTYEKVQQEHLKESKSSTQISAYTQVQNHEQREAFSSRFGISVYA